MVCERHSSSSVTSVTLGTYAGRVFRTLERWLRLVAMMLLWWDQMFARSTPLFALVQVLANRRRRRKGKWYHRSQHLVVVVGRGTTINKDDWLTARAKSSSRTAATSTGSSLVAGPFYVDEQECMHSSSRA